MFRVSPILSVVALSLVSACMTVPPQPSNVTSETTSASATEPAALTPQTFLFSWGMFADPVFDRDVVTFERAFSQAYGTPQRTELFGFVDRRLNDPLAGTMAQTLSEMANEARDGVDTVVVMLTSHGTPGMIAIKTEPNGPIAAMSATQLADFLQPLEADNQILILQACFSGSLIDDLKAPNRIIMTAAADDRSSFGCNPESDNTWFIKSLNRAMTDIAAQDGSWQQVFERTRQLVGQDESAQGVPASNPQSFVGQSMRAIWSDSRDS